ncbi:hypothetical protein Ae201684P_003613 [Aphanomyces euteiches]|nr:hypothetical protein Ae201684P_003613 [Aphanomyces euteiches]
MKRDIEEVSCQVVDESVCLVALSNSYDHYCAIGRKLVSSKAKERGTWLHIDGYLSPYDWCNIDNATDPNAFVASSALEHKEKDLKMLFVRIRDFVTQASTPACIAIDDVSSLTAQYGECLVLNFLRYCRYLALETNNFLTASLVDLSTFVYSVRGLESGYCKDIHGSVTQSRRIFSVDDIKHANTPSTFQYKLVEHGLRRIHGGIDA